MAKRGGYRPGAGRPKGAKTKRPFGNLPSAPPQLPPAPPEVIAAITLVERRNWRLDNEREVHEKAGAWLSELEQRARDEGDLRLVFEILRLRLAYAMGLPGSATGHDGSDIGSAVMRAWAEAAGSAKYDPATRSLEYAYAPEARAIPPPTPPSGDTRQRGERVALSRLSGAEARAEGTEGVSTKVVVDPREAEVSAALAKWDREHGEAGRG